VRLLLAKVNAAVGTARVGCGLELEAFDVSRGILPT
tara:strand:+ start:992 stop:1099 length:108 start_codon:yes stop_codon:yes gene_type:complete